MASFSDVARRGRLMPANSIFYRDISAVAADPHSATIVAQCVQDWPMDGLEIKGYGAEDHTKASNEPTNSSRRQPGYYLDQHRSPGASSRTVSLTYGAGRSNLASSSSATTFAARALGLGDARVQEGHAQSRWPFTKAFFPIGGDRHHVAVSWHRRVHQEAAEYDLDFADGIRCASFVEHSIDSNEIPRYPDGSVARSNGGGVPIAPLLLHYDEIERGFISHMMAVVVWSYWQRESGADGNNIGRAIRWPATNSDGESAFMGAPIGGTRRGPYAGHVMRLRRDFDMSSFTANERVVLRGLQTHGAILMDKHGPTAGGDGADPPAKPARLIVANHPGFDDELDISWERLPITAFEWVDLSSLCAGDPTETWAAA